MKVLLINSPLFRDRNELYDEDSLPPIGLGYIATQLKNDGILVELIDAIDKRIPLQSLIDYINIFQPEFVASNIFTTNYQLVKELIESIEYNCHIIIGGLSTKELHKNILGWNTSNKIDVVIGDGEVLMSDIVNDSINELPFLEIPNRRVFQANGCSGYFVQDISKTKLDRSFFENEPVKHPLGFTEANIVTSRGCIYNCTFCAAARSLNKDAPIREMSEESIKSEISGILELYPKVNSIRVLDDLFLKSKNTVFKAINVFSEFNLQWRSMAHVMTFQGIEDNVMNELKSSGCHELFIGIESGSPKILKSINKTHNLQTILTNLTKVFRAGINVKGYFIYGFPDETELDMDMTFELASKLKDLANKYKVNFRTSVFQYRPYHATEIFHDLEQKGFDMENIQVAPNKDLSDLVGRLQFNFHNGNYSNVEYDRLHDYIYRTINLNDGKIFARLRPKSYTKRMHKV